MMNRRSHMTEKNLQIRETANSGTVIKMAKGKLMQKTTNNHRKRLIAMARWKSAGFPPSIHRWQKSDDWNGVKFHWPHSSLKFIESCKIIHGSLVYTDTFQQLCLHTHLCFCNDIFMCLCIDLQKKNSLSNNKQVWRLIIMDYSECSALVNWRIFSNEPLDYARKHAKNMHACGHY